MLLLISGADHVAHAFSANPPQQSRSASSAASAATSPSTTSTIRKGDKIPWVSLDWGFPPQKVNLPKHCYERNVVIVGLPGAFTPT